MRLRRLRRERVSPIPLHTLYAILMIGGYPAECKEAPYGRPA
jgi:hypothetical protein